MRRWIWWTTAGLCAAVAVALVTVAAVGSLDTADKAASVGGAVAALAGLVLTVRQGLPERPAPDAGGVREVTVQAENGGVAAAGSITTASSGARPEPAPGGPGGTPPRTDRRDVRATGPGSVAAGGDITGIDLNRTDPNRPGP